MIYRKKYLDKLNLRFGTYHLKCFLTEKLKLSFGKNYKICYKNRLGFFIKKFYVNRDHKFYNSQNKAICFMTYSPKVPNACLSLSRFYLVKHSNNLYLSGYQK